MSWVTRLFRHVPKTIRRTKPADRARITLEQLGERLNPVVTDMTAMSYYFPQHDGPTILAVNFDGATNLAGNTAAAFTGSAADKADILYRVSEIFAPFNVQVIQANGHGGYVFFGGATTVFVGDNRAFDGTVTNPAGMVVGILNQRGGVTPSVHSDAPYAPQPDHAPNSNPWDVAFVDPLRQTALNQPLSNTDNAWIAQSIAHEAAHTFGVVHVLGMRNVTNADGTVTSVTTNDMMSYSGNPNEFFADVTLPVTTLNRDPVNNTNILEPSLQPVFTDPVDGVKANITTQNSFTYLGSMLGWRDPHVPMVTHRGSVDAGSYQNFSGTYSTQFSREVDVAAGGYRNYRIRAGKWGSVVNFSVSQVSGSVYERPMALVYRADGTVQHFPSQHLGNGKYGVANYLMVRPGEEFDLVIGGTGGTAGSRFKVDVWLPKSVSSLLPTSTSTTDSLHDPKWALAYPSGGVTRSFAMSDRYDVVPEETDSGVAYAMPSVEVTKVLPATEYEPEASDGSEDSIGEDEVLPDAEEFVDVQPPAEEAIEESAEGLVVEEEPADVNYILEWQEDESGELILVLVPWSSDEGTEAGAEGETPPADDRPAEAEEPGVDEASPEEDSEAPTEDAEVVEEVSFADELVIDSVYVDE